MTRTPGLSQCFEMATATVFHLLFDILALFVGIALFSSERKNFPQAFSVLVKDLKTWRCLASLLIGAVVGYFAFGNLKNSSVIGLSHNLGDAGIGALIALEIFRQSQGRSNAIWAPMILPLVVALGIARSGCHLAGLADPLVGAWIDPGLSIEQVSELSSLNIVMPHPFYGVDFGDGLFRYPVALFEALWMWVFSGLFWLWIWRRPRAVEKFGAPVFFGFMALTSFGLQFLVPYESFFRGLSVLQWLCLGLIIYAVILCDQKANAPALSIKPESTE